MRSLLLRARAPIGAAVTAAALHRLAHAEELPSRFQQLPESLSMQAFRPTVPYPGWDDNWDYCNPSQREVAKRLNHEWPITDYPAAIHKLYADHTELSPRAVDKLIEANKDDLPDLYKRAFVKYAHGGAVTRHIILVRHGQYEEQRALSKRLHAENPHHFGLPGDTKYAELDAARVLTPLGRKQAEKTGDRLAQLLAPALSTPGRESHVRIHVSTLTRAKETAEIIASRLPPHVQRCLLPPDPNLSEGEPAAHTIPYKVRGGEEGLFRRARDLHIEGARIEAAFRSLFYRDMPCRRGGGAGDGGDGGRAGAKGGLPRHEYEIVVCHMNVIRYFTLRALQLPPEAWLRMGGFNGSITHLQIRGDGRVSLVGFGDHGHLSLEETTFGMSQGLEN